MNCGKRLHIRTIMHLMVKVMVYIIAVGGFGHQSLHICNEYFKYPTTTYFEIKDYLPVTRPPKLIVSFPVPLVKPGKRLKDIFTAINDSTIVTYAEVRGSEFGHHRSHLVRKKKKIKIIMQNISEPSSLIDVKTSIRMERFLVTLAPKNPLKCTSSAAYLDEMVLYKVNIATSQSWINREGIVTHMIPSTSDIEGIKFVKSAFPVACLGRYGRFVSCRAEMSYSIAQAVLLPPPYDTECLDYGTTPFTSKDNCHSVCVNSLTKKQGFLVETNTISSQQYENSTLILGPWFLGDLEGFNEMKIISTQAVREMQNLINNFDLKMYSKHLEMCRSLCRKAECYQELVIPILLQRLPIKPDRNVSGANSYVDFSMFPPRNPVMIVSSRPKVKFIDFIVYLLSSMSFWFGVCPLHVAYSKNISYIIKCVAIVRLIILRLKDKLLFRRRRGKRRHTSSLSSVVKTSTVQVVVVMYVLYGFAYQSTHICEEFFSYPTTTHVSITSKVPTTKPPKITMQFWHPSRMGMSVADVFKQYKDDTKIEELTVDQTLIINNNTKEKPTFITHPFYSFGGYFVTLQFRKPLHFDLDSLYMYKADMFQFKMTTNLLSTFQQDADSFKLYMTSYNSDMEGLQRTGYWCDKCFIFNQTRLLLTYTVQISHLAPPPYDTNCRDYRETPFTSSENCFSQCLTDFTKRHGMIIESNVIQRDVYENSSLVLIPGSMRYNQNIKQLSAFYLWNQTRSLPKWLTAHMNWTMGFHRKLDSIMPAYKKNFKNCESLCRTSCLTESFTIKALTESVWTNSVSDDMIDYRLKGRNMSSYLITVLPPDDLVITATSTAKIKFHDFIIYLATSIAFWFGFSPLVIVNNRLISGFFKKYTRGAFHLCYSRSIFLFILYTMVSLGFYYQESEIATEYFKYSTTTVVKIEETVASTIPPTTTIRVKMDFNVYGLMAKQIFEKVNDSTLTIFGDPSLDRETFVSQEYYHLSFRPTKLVQYSPEKLYLQHSPLYQFTINTDLFMRFRASVDITMELYNTDHEKIMPANSGDLHNGRELPLQMTYATKIIKLERTPYDTNCYDYQESGFSSREKCFSQCLLSFTEKHQVILATNIIKRTKYENSSLTIMPALLKSLKVSGKTLTIENLVKAINRQHYSQMATNQAYNEFATSGILSKYKNHWLHCKWTCGREECLSESVLPKKIHGYDPVGKTNSTFRNINVTVYPSDEPIITVTSVPKMSLLDFVVYSLTSVAVWFGFCPLAVPDYWRRSIELVKKKSHFKKNAAKRVSHELLSLKNRLNRRRTLRQIHSQRVFIQRRMNAKVSMTPGERWSNSTRGSRVFRPHPCTGYNETKN